MRQKAQYVPQVQTIELIKEEPQQVIKQVQKSIPKYEMKYINNVITVGPKYMEHVHDVEEEQVEMPVSRGLETVTYDSGWQETGVVSRGLEPVATEPIAGGTQYF